MVNYTEEERKEAAEKHNILTRTMAEVKDSTIPGAGKGLFATKYIKEHTVIGRYWGETINVKSEDNIPEDRVAYCVQLHPKHFIDATNPDYSSMVRYANDANFAGDGATNLTNNAHFEKYSSEKEIWLVATHNIKKGQEILADYKYGIDSEDTKLLIAAGAPETETTSKKKRKASAEEEEEEGEGEEEAPVEKAKKKKPAAPVKAKKQRAEAEPKTDNWRAERRAAKKLEKEASLEAAEISKAEQAKRRADQARERAERANRS